MVFKAGGAFGIAAGVMVAAVSLWGCVGGGTDGARASKAAAASVQSDSGPRMVIYFGSSG